MLRLHLHLMEASACRRPETTWLSCNTAVPFFETPRATNVLSLLPFSTRGRHLPHLVISVRGNLHIFQLIQSFPKSPHLRRSTVFSSRLSFEAVSVSAISLQQRFPERRDAVLWFIYHLRFTSIVCIYIIFHLLYYIILHTTSRNIQVHVLMLCQSPPILCQSQITRIAKVQDEESTRNDKNHKRIIESYKNHVFKKHKAHIRIIVS